LLDKKNLDEAVYSSRSAMETLEIAMDRKLSAQILHAAENLEEDTRHGKLYSFAEAFDKQLRRKPLKKTYFSRQSSV
jgi:hypothetical protein